MDWYALKEALIERAEELNTRSWGGDVTDGQEAEVWAILALMDEMEKNHGQD